MRKFRNFEILNLYCILGSSRGLGWKENLEKEIRDEVS
jgi:hypothetical protein